MVLALNSLQIGLMSGLLFKLSTLDYLINEQDGIGEQGGKFLKILKRAGWNKRAEGAKKIASINEQKGNPSCFNFQMKISYSVLLLCDRKVIRYLLGIVLVNY